MDDRMHRGRRPDRVTLLDGGQVVGVAGGEPGQRLGLVLL
jgi:hypothetical protein